MPELPDLTVYIEALERHVCARTLTAIDLASPFVLRTTEPAIGALVGHDIIECRRLGKRIALGFNNGMWLVIHLMLAGRLVWAEKPGGKGGRNTLARLHFGDALLTFTEAGSRKRASLHLLADSDALTQLDPGGLEVMSSTLAAFSATLTLRNHTLKRALTDARLFSGIGNAYSDEILHAAQLSPIQHTQKLRPEEIARLHQTMISVLARWIDTLRALAGADFPGKVSAFRDGMAVHGRFGQPCPRCGSEIQRIRYVGNELNYCPRCQTDGRLLADRALSRLLHKEWPRTLEELENSRSSPDA